MDLKPQNPSKKMQILQLSILYNSLVNTYIIFISLLNKNQTITSINS